MESKILSIDQIVCDEELYPRFKYGWITAYQYSQAMVAGANFPPITVAEFEGQYLLVDGRHRLEATKMNKESSIQCEILTGLSKEQLFVEAVKRNIANARPFSPQEKARIALKLQSMKFTSERISEAIRVPFDKLESFVANRVTHSISGEELILKAPLKNLSGETVQDNIGIEQHIISATSQEHIIDQLTMLLETNSVKRTPRITNKLKYVRKLIGNFVLKRK